MEHDIILATLSSHGLGAEVLVDIRNATPFWSGLISSLHCKSYDHECYERMNVRYKRCDVMCIAVYGRTFVREIMAKWVPKQSGACRRCAK